MLNELLKLIVSLFQEFLGVLVGWFQLLFENTEQESQNQCRIKKQIEEGGGKFMDEEKPLQKKQWLKKLKHIMTNFILIVFILFVVLFAIVSGPRDNSSRFRSHHNHYSSRASLRH